MRSLQEQVEQELVMLKFESQHSLRIVLICFEDFHSANYSIKQ